MLVRFTLRSLAGNSSFCRSGRFSDRIYMSILFLPWQATAGRTSSLLPPPTFGCVFFQDLLFLDDISLWPFAYQGSPPPLPFFPRNASDQLFFMWAILALARESPQSAAPKSRPLSSAYSSIVSIERKWSSFETTQLFFSFSPLIFYFFSKWGC